MLSNHVRLNLHRPTRRPMARTHTYLSIYPSVYISMHLSISICIYICIYIYVCTHIQTTIRMYIYITCSQWVTTGALSYSERQMWTKYHTTYIQAIINLNVYDETNTVPYIRGSGLHKSCFPQTYVSLLFIYFDVQIELFCYHMHVC